MSNLGIIDWVRASYCGSTLESGVNSFYCNAVVAGHNRDQAPLWVIRARHEDELVPGKMIVNHDSAFAYIPVGREVRVYDFEIMVAPPHSYRWVRSSNGAATSGAIRAGYNTSGDPLYVGRVKHQSCLTPGKVDPVGGCCYISFEGNQIYYKQYEILCSI